MYTLSKIMNGYNSSDYKEYVCFSIEDFETLKDNIIAGKERCAPASNCFVLPDKHYVYDDNGEWISIISGGSGSGSTSGGASSDTTAEEERPSAFGGDVRFYDYDGHQLYSYSATRFLTMTRMPQVQDHISDGLVAQGWNFSIDEAKDYVQKYGMLDVGSVYDTNDGATKIYVTLDNGKTSPYVGVALNGSATIDWGDGNESAITGTSTTSALLTRHDYGAAGDYVIEIKLSSGQANIVGTSTKGSLLFSGNGTTSSQNICYNNAVTRIHIGSSFGIGQYAFMNLSNAKTITVYDGANISAYAFYNCKGVEHFTAPKNSGLGQYSFAECSRLRTISVPNMTIVPPYFMSSCDFVRRFCIPDGVETVGQNAFSSCRSMVNILVPSFVNKLETNSFASCFGLSSITFTSQTPPQASSSTVFSNLPTDCVIKVPAGTSEAYSTSTNYPSRSVYTYKEV